MPAAWLEREPLLRALAAWWIVSDPVEPADAVAVFGGGLQSRPFAAAAYYTQGLVKRVVISGVAESRAERIGAEIPHIAANRAVLLKLGVPESAIGVFGSNLTNTESEAVALHEWALAAGVRSILVPTEIFTARRVRWALRRAFGQDAEIRVVALDPDDYDRTNWWRHENGVVMFQNEIIKYLFYRIAY